MPWYGWKMRRPCGALRLVQHHREPHRRAPRVDQALGTRGPGRGGLLGPPRPEAGVGDERDAEDLGVDGDLVLEEAELGLVDAGVARHEGPWCDQADELTAQGVVDGAEARRDVGQERVVLVSRIAPRPLPPRLDLAHRAHARDEHVVHAEGRKQLRQRRHHDQVPLGQEDRVPLQALAAIGEPPAQHDVAVAPLPPLVPVVGERPEVVEERTRARRRSAAIVAAGGRRRGRRSGTPGLRRRNSRSRFRHTATSR